MYLSNGIRFDLNLSNAARMWRTDRQTDNKPRYCEMGRNTRRNCMLWKSDFA